MGSERVIQIEAIRVCTCSECKIRSHFEISPSHDPDEDMYILCEGNEDLTAGMMIVVKPLTGEFWQRLKE